MQASVTEARAKLSKLIDKVENGAAVVITRRGHPTALLVAATKARPSTRIGGIAGRLYRMGKGFDRITSSDRLADEFGVARGW
jgi:prevent-host-death family protein